MEGSEGEGERVFREFRGGIGGEVDKMKIGYGIVGGVKCGYWMWKKMERKDMRLEEM